jgi:type VI secretion system secreted protein VgrG
MSALPRRAAPDLAALMDCEPRLYRLEAPGALSTLRVEAWVAEEALDEPGRLEICALAADPRLDLDAMLGGPVTLVTRLADGREHRRGGLVDLAIAEDCDGALARYRLVVRPWPWFLCMSLRCQVWQDRSVLEIVDSLLARYAAWARWRWSPCALRHVNGAHRHGLRPYTVQYRETDLDFMSRLLAEEGIGYRLAHTPDGMALELFADSRLACPEDATSARAPIAFQHAATQDGTDTLQRLDGACRAAVDTLTTLSHCEELGRGEGWSLPARQPRGGPRLESYDAPGATTFATRDQAARTLRLLHEAIDARRAYWSGQSVVRSFTSGTTFHLAEALHDLDSGEPLREAHLLLTRVQHVGINNLPGQLSRALLERFGPEPVLPVQHLPPELLASARQRGYANGFEAIHADTPWRPLRPDADGLRTFRKPDPGFLLATVVGPDGSTQPRGADEVHTDRLGRVRIRYEFQGDEDAAPGTSLASCWVRVLQPLAGSGGRGAMGAQWTPRIGHEVLVQCLDGDIDRPVVVCSLYNGRGEGGELPTPGGKPHAGARPVGEPFSHGSDARPAGQGNLTNGASPAWHGASPAPVERGGQNNAAALSGYKSKELGGNGFNQLVHDDTPRQERLQLATTQHASQLNLGHLIHQADNHRGSFRGLGFEARTDAYGALRAARGVLLSTYLADWSAPAMEDAAGLAVARQFQALALALHEAAHTHQTVALSGLLGTFAAGASALDPKAAPIPAWVKQAEGRGSARSFESAQADAQAKKTQPAEGSVPQSNAPVVNLSARAGVAVAAARDVALTAGENLHLSSGAGLDVAAGGAARVHAGQAIGVLGGAMQPGGDAAGTGLTVIAGAGDVELQAQDGPMQVAALRDVTFQTVHGAIDWAAAKRIVISTAGGAALVMENGNVEFIAPGTFTVQAGKRSFVGGAHYSYRLPPMPQVPITSMAAKFDMTLRDVPGPHGMPLPEAGWRIVHAESAEEAMGSDELLFSGCGDAQGRMTLDDATEQALHAAWNRTPGRLWVVCEGHAHRLTLAAKPDDWTEQQALHHALDAMGYADSPQSADGQNVDAFHAPRARKETLQRHGQALLDRLKNQGGRP